MITTGRSQFIEKLHNLLEHSPDSACLRWVSAEAFEITCDDKRACQALKPAWDFKSLNSFVRQLSYYNFTRLSDRRRSIERQPLPTGTILFTHPSGFFVPGDDSRLAAIVRQTRKRSARRPRVVAGPSSPPVATGGIGALRQQQVLRVPEYDARLPSEFSPEASFPSVRPSAANKAPRRNFERVERHFQHHARKIEGHPTYNLPRPFMHLEHAEVFPFDARHGLGIESDPYALANVGEHLPPCPSPPYPSPTTTPTFESFPDGVHSPQLTYGCCTSAAPHAPGQGLYRPKPSPSSYAPPSPTYPRYTTFFNSSQDDVPRFAPYEPRGDDASVRSHRMAGDGRRFSESYFPLCEGSGGGLQVRFEEGYPLYGRPSLYGRRGTMG